MVWQRYGRVIRQAAASQPMLQWDWHEPDVWLAFIPEDGRAQARGPMTPIHPMPRRSLPAAKDQLSLTPTTRSALDGTGGNVRAAPATLPTNA